MRRNDNKNGWRRPTVARRRGDRLITLVCFTPLRDREASTIPFSPSPPWEKGKPLFSLTRSGIALATYNAYAAPPLGTKASNKGALCKSSYLTVFPPHIRASLSNTYRIDAYCSTRRPFLMNRWTSFIWVYEYRVIRRGEEMLGENLFELYVKIGAWFFEPRIRPLRDVYQISSRSVSPSKEKKGKEKNISNSGEVRFVFVVYCDRKRKYVRSKGDSNYALWCARESENGFVLISTRVLQSCWYI